MFYALKTNIWEKNRPLKTGTLNRFKVFKCKSLKEQKCYSESFTNYKM
jgi:hypothetical protein